MQETKCKDDNFPEFNIRTSGFDVCHYGLSQYNGVSILSKDPIKNISLGMDNARDPYIDDARLIKGDIDGITFVSVYAPNGRDRTSEHFEKKLDWYNNFIDYASTVLQNNPRTIITGDLNIAPHDSDVWDINEFPLTTHVTQEERAKFQALCDIGFTDAFRHLYPTDRSFTFWDYRGGDFHQNKGMRIDFFLVSKDLVENIKGISVDRDSRKGEKPSDHAALILDLEFHD